MQHLTTAVSSVIAVPLPLALGGDAQVTIRPQPDGAVDEARMSQLMQHGVITGIARVAPTTARLVRKAGDPHAYLVMRAMGVDPATYPLLGTVALSEPASSSATAILDRRGAVIVTRDLARKLTVAVGDTLLLAGEPGAAPQRLVVGGIAQRLPVRRGDTMLYGLGTAADIANSPDAVRLAFVTLANPADTVTLRDAGLDIETAAAAGSSNTQVADLFGTMLKGAGLLGLLLGGVGVANTLQVILARRSTEIATLKTLGYRQSDLLLLFALETGLLGVVGSILGACAGVLVGQQLTGLLSNMETALLLEFHMLPSVLAAGVAIGTVTALVFGMHAIVRTSAVRPAVLLRNLPVTLDARGRRILAGLHAVLLITIIGINALVLGSLLKGVALSVIAVLALLLLGGGLSLVLQIVLRLPMRGRLGIARRNLGRRPLRSAFALLALFAGVFSIGVATTVFLGGRREVLARTIDVTGENVFVYGSRADSARITNALRNAGPVRQYYDVRVQPADSGRRAMPVRGIPDANGVVLLPGSNWTGADDEALIVGYPNVSRAPANGADAGPPSPATVRIHTADGVRELRIVGRYAPAAATTLGGVPPMLVSLATAGTIDPRGTPVWALSIEPSQLDAVSARISRDLPDVVIVTAADFRDFLNRVFRGLFRFVAGVSALALLGGVVLIANAVGLALVERRRELGVLKAVGYGRNAVLSLIALENGLLGAIGGTAGVAAVLLANAIVNITQPRAHMRLAPTQALVLVALAIVLSVGTAIVVAWRTTGLRPLVVLREE
jgi:putative ABC transport system permease protein